MIHRLDPTVSNARVALEGMLQQTSVHLRQQLEKGLETGQKAIETGQAKLNELTDQVADRLANFRRASAFRLLAYSASVSERALFERGHPVGGHEHERRCLGGRGRWWEGALLSASCYPVCWGLRTHAWRGSVLTFAHLRWVLPRGRWTKERPLVERLAALYYWVQIFTGIWGYLLCFWLTYRFTWRFLIFFVP